MNNAPKYLIIGALVLVGLAIAWKIFKGGPEETGREIDPGDGCDPRFDEVNETVAIHDQLSEWDIWNDQKSAAFNRILALNDCELKKVHNQYIKRYKGDEYPTLRRLVQGEYIFYGDAAELRNHVLNRLQEIGA